MSVLNRILGASLFLMASHIEPYRADGQVSSKAPWEPFPQEFVLNMATKASVERESIQRAIQLEKLIHDQLQQKRAAATGLVDKAIRTEIINSSKKLERLQDGLTAAVKKGKDFKDLIGRPDKLVVKKLEKMDVSYFQAPSILQDTKKPDIPSSVAMNSPAIEVQKGTMHKMSDLPNELNPPSPAKVQEDCLFQSPPPGTKDKPGLALRPEVLLKYTPDVLRKYMGGRAYITGHAFMGTEPGLTYFQLHLEFATEQALQQYGNLGKSVLFIHLIDGKEIRLVVNRFDQGTADPALKKSAMAGVYYLDKSNERLLADSPVDRIRLVFATGYEEFVIYNVDFFTRQLACINAQK